MPAPRLHDYVATTGFGPDTTGSQKWRRFSPADVLRLTTIRSLKKRTGAPLSRLKALIRFLGTKAFAANALMEWRFGKRPLLITDLGAFNEVAASASVDLELLEAQGGPLVCALSLDCPVRLALAAAIRGGSENQRLAALETAVRARVDAEHKAKRGRKIEIYPEAEEADLEVVLRSLLVGLEI